MPYVVGHEVCVPPDTNATRIWRYMGLPAFIELVRNKSLHFSRAHLLGDPHEGALTVPTAKYWANIAQRSTVPESWKGLDELRKSVRSDVGVSCWHMSERESALLWKTYGGESGIAVRSTFQRLVDSVARVKTDVFISKVHYVDYDAADIRCPGNVLSPFVHKRLSFLHDQELRAFVWGPLWKEGAEGVSESGFRVSVDRDSLIDSVYVCPTMPNWMHDLVINLSLDYGLSKSIVHRSDLSRDPVF